MYKVTTSITTRHVRLKHLGTFAVHVHFNRLRNKSPEFEMPAV